MGLLSYLITALVLLGSTTGFGTTGDFLLKYHLYKCDDYREFYVRDSAYSKTVYITLSKGFPEIFTTLSLVSAEKAEIVGWKNGSSIGVIGIIEKANPVRITVDGKNSKCEPRVDCKKAFKTCHERVDQQRDSCWGDCYRNEGWPEKRLSLCLHRCDSWVSEWRSNCNDYWSCAHPRP